MMFNSSSVIIMALWKMCWEKSNKGKSINGLLMHAERARYGVCRKKCFISYVRILYVNGLASIDTSVWTLKTFPVIIAFKCQDIEDIAYMSSRVFWHFMTRSYKCKGTSLDGKVFTCRTLYGNTVRYYWRTKCIDGEFILYVTFLVLNYLKDY